MTDPFGPLLARGIRPPSLAHFRVCATTRYCPSIGDTRPCVRYPVWATTGELLGYHLKFMDGQKPKYRWDGEPAPEALDQVYNVESIQAGHCALLVEGFPDVWLMHTLALPAVWLVSGVSSTPRPAAIAALRDAAPSMVAVIYDNDAAGRTGAVCTTRALQDAGIAAMSLALPPALPEHADVTDLYAWCGRDHERFMRAIHNLQPLPLSTPASRPYRAPRPVGCDRRALYQEFKSTHRIEEVVQDAIALKPQAGGRRLVGCCPFHDDSTPSFVVFPEDQHAHCFGCSWHGDVIAFLERWQGRAVVA